MLAILLSGLVASAAAAAPAVVSRVTHVAPYKGFVNRIYGTSFFGCSAKAKVLTAPHLNLTSGSGGVNLSSSAAGCGTGLGGSDYLTDEGDTYSNLELQTPLKSTHGGVHHLVVHWNFAGRGLATVHPGTCSPNASANQALCETFAAWTLESYVYFYDATTQTYSPSGSVIYLSGYVDNYTACTSYCLTFQSASSTGLTGSYAAYLNVSANSGDRCLALIDLFSQTKSYVKADNATTTSASTKAGLDLASPALGYGWTLVSVVDS